MLSDKDQGIDSSQRGSNGDREEQTTGNIARLQCPVCRSTFRRPEHLKRHLRSHTKEKPFECAQCGRHFSRTDTLHRHELSHHMPGAEGGKDRAHRITVKTFRACVSCATARVRCSGGTPCGRCDSRSLECQYPTERGSKAQARRGGSRGPSSSDAQKSDIPTAQLPSRASEGKMQSNNLRANPQPQTHQLAQFHVTGLHSQFSPTSDAVPDSAKSRPENVVSDVSGPVAGPSNPHLYLPNASQASAGAGVPLSSYNGEGRSHAYHDISSSNTPKMFSVSGTTAMGPDLRNIQPGLANPGDGIAMAGNLDVSLDFNPALFDQSMLSTINWLPHEFFAGPANDQTQSSSLPPPCSQPIFPDAHLARTTWQPPVITTGQISPSIPENVTHAPSNHLLATDMGSPNYPRIQSEASPHSASVDSTKRSGDYYVDGSGARLPKYRKKQARWSQTSVEPVDIISQLQRDSSDSRRNFPKIQEIRMENISEEASRFTRPIETSTYDEIYRHFLLLCRNDHPIFEEFESENFPTADECTRFIVVYFDSFQAVYPILHLPTFDPNHCHWLLTLAVVAIGCHASNIPETDQCTAAFHEMIRRALSVEREKSRPGEAPLDILQAMLFNCIGLLHSGSERASFHALRTFGDLVTLMNREKLLLPSPNIESSGPEQESTWMAWIRDEARRRAGYCIWLVDCTLAYSFDCRTLLALDDGQAALPAHEKLWQANSPESWRQLWEKSTPNESLYDAVQSMYIEKRLVSGIGEFSHILLIHALYQRMWEVGDYFRRPLSFWNPTAQKQNRETAVPTGSVWLPGIPSYSKWRNSACDCLDILHWTANSTIAKAAGLEHPTVLHLHAARVVLLAPFREIRSLATSLATNKLHWNKRYQAIEWEYIRRWKKHDQYKARLSIIHAGTTLWHVRRYSTNAFHEPVAAFLAVLTLWAYGSCYVNEDSRPEPSPAPSFIHLDRPCDEELVQLFVRVGHAMRGTVTGVGDICAPEGPERILRVGCETLSSLTAWGISKQFIAILTRLADLVSRYPTASEQSRISG